MDLLLAELLESLETLGETYHELYDSDVREKMGAAILDGLVRRRPEFKLPDEFGMFSGDANLKVGRQIEKYIEAANRLADDQGILLFHPRLAAFQNSGVRTCSKYRLDYEDLFGHTPPDWYDPSGNVIWDRVR